MTSNILKSSFFDKRTPLDMIPFLFLQGDENGIYEAVGSVGPVSICYDVTMGFQLYKKGVYSRYSPIPTPVWNEPSHCSDVFVVFGACK